MPEYINVTSDESTDQEPIELPTEEDKTMLLSTVAAQFPNCTGLKYRHPDTGGLRGIRLAEGVLHAPEDGWGTHLYIAAFSQKASAETKQLKRKSEDATELAAKRISSRGRCVDLVVLGLAWKTSEEVLKEYFTEFGEVAMCQIKKDRKTGQPKGFGFVRFVDYQSQVKCLGMQQHSIDKCWCDVKIPNSQIQNTDSSKVNVESKIYVGRCGKEIEAEDLFEYFEKFGEVVDVFVPKPHREFAFVTFSDPDVARGLFGGEYTIKSCKVHVSSAAPKNYNRQDRQQQPSNSGYGNDQNQRSGYGNSGSRWGGYSSDYNQSNQNQYSSYNAPQPVPPPPIANNPLNALANTALANNALTNNQLGSNAFTPNPLAGNLTQNLAALNPTMVAAAAAALAQGGLGNLLNLASQAATGTTSTSGTNQLSNNLS